VPPSIEQPTPFQSKFFSNLDQNADQQNNNENNNNIDIAEKNVQAITRNKIAEAQVIAVLKRCQEIANPKSKAKPKPKIASQKMHNFAVQNLVMKNSHKNNAKNTSGSVFIKNGQQISQTRDPIFMARGAAVVQNKIAVKGAGKKGKKYSMVKNSNVDVVKNNNNAQSVRFSSSKDSAQQNSKNTEKNTPPGPSAKLRSRTSTPPKVSGHDKYSKFTADNNPARNNSNQRAAKRDQRQQQYEDKLTRFFYNPTQNYKKNQKNS